MRTLLALLLVLAGAVACFVVRGLPAYAAADKAHADLLRRERTVQQIQAALPPRVGEELAALQADRDQLANIAQRRLAVLSDDQRAASAPRPTLEEVLAASDDPLLAEGGKLATSLRLQAATSPRASAALALILSTIGKVHGVRALELDGGGQAVAVPGIEELEQIRAQLELIASLPDALAIVERLCPSSGTGLPGVSVVAFSIRRIEPERWGLSLDGPPVRLAADLSVCFPKTGSAP